MTFHYDFVSTTTTTTKTTTSPTHVNNTTTSSKTMHTPSSSSSIARNDMPRHRESPTSMAMAGKSKFDDGQLMQRLEDSLGICDLEEASLASSKYTQTTKEKKKKQLELEYRGHGSAPVKTTTTTKTKKKKSTSSSSAAASKTKKPLQSIKKPSQSQQEENRRLYESLHDSLLEDLDDEPDDDQEDREFQLALRSMRLKRLESTRRLSSAALDTSSRDSTHVGGTGNRDRTKSDGSQESLSIWSLHSAPAATFRQGDAFSEENGYNASHARLMLHVHDTTASNSKLDDSDLSLSRFLHDIWHDETTTGTTNQEYSEDHEALYWYDLKQGQVLPPQDMKKRSVPPGYCLKDELYAKVQLQRLALASMSQSGHGTPQRKSLKRSNSNESVASMASKSGWFASAKRGAEEDFGNHSMHGLPLQDPDQLLQMDSSDDIFSERGFAWACSSSSSINSTTMDSSSTHSITDGSRRRRTLDRALSNKSERSITTRSRMPQKTSSKQSKSRRHLMKKDISTTSMLSSMSNASKSRRQLMQEAKFNLKSNRSMASSSATPLMSNTATAQTPGKQRRSFTKPTLAINTYHWGRFAPMAASLKYDQEDVEFLVFNDREFHKLQRALRKGTVVTNTYVSAILPSLMKQSQRKRLAYVQRQEQEDLLYQQQQQHQSQEPHHYQSLPNMNGMNDSSHGHNSASMNFNQSIGNMSEDLRGIRSTMSHRSSSKPQMPPTTHVVTAAAPSQRRRSSQSKSKTIHATTTTTTTTAKRGSASKLPPSLASMPNLNSSSSQSQSQSRSESQSEEARRSMAHHGMVPKRDVSGSKAPPPSSTTVKTSKRKNKNNKVETPTRTPIASNRTCKTKQQTPQLQAFAASLADLVKEEEKKMEADVEFDVEVEC